MSPNNSFDCVPEDLKQAAESRGVAGSTDFDTAIALTGYGKFHFKIISVCALCLLSNGLQNGLSSYVFAAAQCELDLTSAQIGLLNVSFLVGGIVSAFFWGAGADLCGRRKILLISLTVDSLVTVACALAINFPVLASCRFFNGFFIGAAGSISFNYIAEFHAPKQRTKSVCYSGAFFTMAWLLLPTIAYLVLPLNEIPIRDGYYISSWRIYMLFVAVPEVVTVILLSFCPESPKFLMERGLWKESLEVLKKMYASNKGLDEDTFPVVSFDLYSDEVKMNGVVACEGRVKRMLTEMMVQLKNIFRPPLVVVTVLMCTITYCNIFGYFGLGLWIPEIFMRFERYHEQYPNVSVSIKQLASLQNVDTTNNGTCGFVFNEKLFRNTLLTGAASLAGNLISGFTSGRVALKLVPLLTMLIGAVSSGIIYWLTSSMQNLITACIFQASMATANVAIGSVAVELFPTSVAAMALCLTMLCGRLGAMVSNIVFGLLMDQHCEIPIFLVSLMLILGTILCFLIPNGTVKRQKFNWFAAREIPNIAVISSKKLDYE